MIPEIIVTVATVVVEGSAVTAATVAITAIAVTAVTIVIVAPAGRRRHELAAPTARAAVLQRC